jgi:hypothetical protein
MYGFTGVSSSFFFLIVLDSSASFSRNLTDSTRVTHNRRYSHRELPHIDRFHITNHRTAKENLLKFPVDGMEWREVALSVICGGRYQRI